MLKLLKYEWKACARTCLPLYGAVLLVSIINRIFGLFTESPLPDNRWVELISVLMAFVYFGIMVALFVVTAVLLIQRFYKSLLGDEGYLMFTLPVTVGQHIWVKTIIAFVMSVLSGIAAILSVGILAYGFGTLPGIGKLIVDICKVFAQQPQSILYAIEMLLFCVICAVCGILFLYLCIALGHLARKHRVAMAVVWYFVLSTALQLVGATLVVLLDESPLYWALYHWGAGIPHTLSLHVGLLAFCVIALVPAAAFFFGTQYILKNKLNLE